MRSRYCGVRGDKVGHHTKQAGIKTVIKQSVPAFSAPVYHNRFPACFLILLYPFSLVQPAFQLTVAERQNHLDILLFFQNTLYPPFSRCMRVFNIGSVIIQFLYYIGFKVKILWKMPCDGILKYLRCIQICELFHLTYKIIVIHVKIFLFQCLRTNSLK